MEKRRLGRTGHMSTIVIYGGAALGNRTQEEANAALDMALAAGVNHIDVAPTYGKAEQLMGPWLEQHRDKFFLGCKTEQRGRDEAWKALENSIRLLRTDRLDLHQLHAVTSFEELDQATAKGGALEVLIEARDQGLAKWLGITGHGWDAPAVFSEALERFDFDTVMFPIFPGAYANPDYRREAEKLLDTCAARDVGVMIIKSVARQAWGERARSFDTWYEPYSEQERINLGVRFALSQHPVTAIPAAGDVRLLPLVLQAAENFVPMPQDEQEALIEQAKDLQPFFA
jgi:aryl-alcohol dehydrogenase-like predicted oxidoreductase